MKKLLSFLFSVLFFSLTSNAQEGSDYKVNKVLSMDLNASVNPATLDYFQSGFKKAESNGTDLIAIRINTPGGLVSVTKDILTLFGASNIPVLIWVGPEGASATSAGAIIASGAHLLFMSEGSNIGAAAPVGLGKDIDPPSTPDNGKENKALEKQKQQAASDMKKKAVNDLVALVTSLAESRGRNVKAYEQMITEAASFTSQDALKKNIIDDTAPDLFSAVLKSNNRKIRLHEESFVLFVDDPVVIEHEMGLGQKLLNILANPSLAYILFLLGAALIYFELQAPGGFVAGAMGLISLVLAGLAFQVLPLNFGSLALIILAFVFFIIEIYVTSFGLLSLAGIISLIVGSLFLFKGETGTAELPLSLILSVSGSIAAFVILIGVFWASEARKNKNQHVGQGLVGQKAKVLDDGSEEDGQYRHQVKVVGEMWRAFSREKLSKNDWVYVIEQNKEALSLRVSKQKGEIKNV
ncbi:nodulation protein NfeD [bacterium]|nr:nodulation protein NfeD [bacterium]